MELKQLLNDDRGVSPVIGVILMVAITVILAAVIGTFVLGLGSNVGNNAPSATFSYEYENISSGGSPQWINVTSQGGDSIDPANVNISAPITGGGSDSIATDGSGSGDNISISDSNAWEDPVQAGDTLHVESSGGDIAAGGDVQLIWSSDGGSTSIISSSTTPA